MKNVSTGFGLCIVGLGIAAWPVLDRLMPQANAVGVGAIAPAVAAVSLAQGPPEPTIVWYGASESSGNATLFRAWSNGRVEARRGHVSCSSNDGPVWRHYDGGWPGCENTWVIVSDPASGLTFDADLNFDQAVDGADLGMLLAKWGPAPRNPVPPSDCPLALINP